MRALILPLLALAACTPFTFSIDGSDREVSEVSASIRDGANGQPVIDISILSDPSAQVADDEISVGVSLDLVGFDNLFIGAPIELGQEVLGSFSYGCECSIDGTAPPLVSGTVNFRFLSDTEASGEIDLVLSGADPNGIDLGTVLLQGNFEASR
jgi:hypothetical protein